MNESIWYLFFHQIRKTIVLGCHGIVVISFCVSWDAEGWKSLLYRPWRKSKCPLGLVVLADRWSPFLFKPRPLQASKLCVSKLCLLLLQTPTDSYVTSLYFLKMLAVDLLSLPPNPHFSKFLKIFCPHKWSNNALSTAYPSVF